MTEEGGEDKGDVYHVLLACGSDEQVEIPGGWTEVKKGRICPRLTKTGRCSSKNYLLSDL